MIGTRGHLPPIVTMSKEVLVSIDSFHQELEHTLSNGCLEPWDQPDGQLDPGGGY